MLKSRSHEQLHTTTGAAVIKIGFKRYIKSDCGVWSNRFIKKNLKNGVIQLHLQIHAVFSNMIDYRTKPLRLVFTILGILFIVLLQVVEISSRLKRVLIQMKKNTSKFT